MSETAYRKMMQGRMGEYQVSDDVEEGQFDGFDEPLIPEPKPSKQRRETIKHHQSTVRSFDGRDQQRKAAFIPASALESAKPWYIRMVGVVILLIGVASSVATFNGSWSLRPELQALLLGIGLQVGVTLTEWFYRNERLSLAYFLAVCIGAGVSIVGLSALLLKPFMGFVSGLTDVVAPDKTVSVAVPIAWLLIAVVSLIIEILPELILIDNDR